MKNDWWLPGWQEKVEAAPMPLPPSIPAPPLSRSYLSGRVHFVQEPDQASEMVQAAYRESGLLDRNRYRVPIRR